MNLGPGADGKPIKPAGSEAAQAELDQVQAWLNETQQAIPAAQARVIYLTGFIDGC